MDKLRDFLKSWPGKAILALCLAPMVLLGLDSYFGGSRMSDDTVAQVGEQNISLQALQQEVQATKAELSTQYDASSIDDAALQAQMLDNVINRALIQEQSRKLGMKFSEEAITRLLVQQSNFLDANGQFSNDLFVAYLRRTGLTKDALIASFGADLAMRQLMTGILSTAIYPNSQVDRLIDLQLVSRDVWIHRLSWQNYADQVSVTDSEISTYYDAHKDEHIMTRPETVDLSYIILPRSVATDAVSDEELNTAYQNFIQAGGYGNQKQLAQILISGDDAANRANAVKAQLDAGADFAELAKTHSDDPTGATGGNIGTFNAAVFGEDAAKVANVINPLNKDDISEVVTTSFGHHIFKVVEVVGNEPPSLESVKDTLTRQIQDNKQTEVLIERVTNINNMALDEMTLTDIARESGLSVQTINNYPKKDNRTALPHPAVIAAAFDDLTLLDQTVSTSIDLPNAVVWVQPSNHRPAAVMTKEEAHPIIKDLLIKTKASELALAAAQDFAKNVTQATLAQMTALGTVSRADISSTLDASELASLFIHDNGEDISAWAVATDEGASVLAGSAVTKETVARMPPEQKHATAAMMKEVLGQDYLADYLLYLHSVHEVQVNQNALNGTHTGM